ncbi:hypothetical protein G5714_002859 [Onychostoma macrolepis]|uniref:HECT domain-containing protein n=1 Tax=Onychostoma macrolepis TaxID=369639 RepID=A0A7J6D7Y1_9TELE|nr:hypothetical protein G5714_002859 [Onychostoma macrolepis]
MAALAAEELALAAEELALAAEELALAAEELALATEELALATEELANGFRLHELTEQLSDQSHHLCVNRIAEPEQGIAIQLQYPDGTRRTRNFVVSQPIQDLFAFAGSDDMASEIFRLQLSWSSNTILSTVDGSLSDHEIRRPSTLYVLWMSGAQIEGLIESSVESSTDQPATTQDLGSCCSPSAPTCEVYALDSEDEEEDVVMLTSPVYSNHESDDDVTAADIIRTFQKENINLEEKMIVVARRRKVLHSACTALKSSYFAWLLMQDVQSSFVVFEGKAGQIVFTYDQVAVEMKRYYTAGKLIAWSLMHGGPGIKALDTTLFKLMCGQPDSAEEFDITCQMLKFKIKCDRTADMISQFKEGMNSCANMWQIIELNWKVFLPLFTNKQKELTREDFRGLFKMCWKKQSAITFQEMLVFITGADSIPPLGFPGQPRIEFYTQENRRLPYVSTCGMVLFLPRGIQEEEELTDLLNTALKGYLGFGKI